MLQWQSVVVGLGQSIDHIAHALEHMTYLRMVEFNGYPQNCPRCGLMFNPRPTDKKL